MNEEWITIEDLILEFEDDIPRTLQNGNTEQERNVKKVNESIRSARLLIETYLRTALIPLPASQQVRETLRECIYNITRYFYRDTDLNEQDPIRVRYEQCIDYLQRIASRKVKITDDDRTDGMTFVKIWRG